MAITKTRSSFPFMGCFFVIDPILRTAASLLSPSFEKEGKKLDKKNIKNYINDPYIGVSPSATIFYMAPILAIAGKAGWVRRIPLESFEKGVAFFKMYIKRMT